MSLTFSGGQLFSTDGTIAPPWDVNLAQSVYSFLSGTSIYRQIHPPNVPVSGGPLAFHYPKLTLSLAYPTTLAPQNLPHVALEEGPAADEEDITMGSPLRSRAKMFTIHGFAGSYQHPGKNSWERSQLLGDIRQLFADARIPLYDFSEGSSLTPIGTGQSRILSAGNIPPNAPAAAEKYRFQVTVQIEY